MTKEEVELLIKICDFYRTVSQKITGGESCELDKTGVEDTLIRIKIGEYLVVKNPNW